MVKDMKEPASTQEIINMVEVLLNEKNGSLFIDSKLMDIAGWDSMGRLLLMAELDERFGITLKENELAALKSVENIISTIDSKGMLAK